MKKWMISDIRWATFDDLKLPFWQKWNKANPLPPGFWQRIWEYPYAALHVPQQGSTIDIGGTYPFVLFKNWPNSVSLDARNLNKVDSPYLKGKWPKGKLIVADAANTNIKNNSYDYAISISAIEEMPNTIKVLKEMIKVAKHRVVVTIDVSDELGVNRPLLREIESFLGISIPIIPPDPLRSNDHRLNDYGQPWAPDFRHIRVLGFVIDSTDKLYDVGILIPHWESLPFIDACIKGIKKQKNSLIQQHIYVLDDFSQDGSWEKLQKSYQDDNDVTLTQFKRPDHTSTADVGALLDQGLKLVPNSLS